MTLNPLSFKPGCNNHPDVIREQFRRNIQRDGIEKLQLHPANDVPVAIVCGGPSLVYRWKELEEFDGIIIACNGAYNFLREKYIFTDYFMLLDSREENLDFVRYRDAGTKFLLAAQCHPKIFDHLPSHKTIMYFTNLPDIKDLIPEALKSCILQGGVGTVGMKAMSAAFAMGYRRMHLFGYDSSYEDDNHHAYPQPLNDETARIEVFVEDRKYITSPSLAHQAQEFCGWAKDLVQFHGCSIELHCHGLLPDLVNHCNRLGESKSLEDREREKYEQIWDNPRYRKISPGENLVDVAYNAMGMDHNQCLIDFGCGTGRAVRKFRERYKVQAFGIDHTEKCLDPDIKIPFQKNCLWQPIDIYADWGFCTDVMEHIPTEKVDAVLKNIAHHVIDGCFFNIATCEDSMGSIIGRKLHMTVANAQAWKEILKKYFRVVQMIESEVDAIFLCWHVDSKSQSA